MKCKKLICAVTGASLLLTSILFGCNSSSTTSDGSKNQNTTVDAIGKYDPPITLTAVKVLPSFVKFKDGEDIDNNIWTRAYEEKLGIKIKYLWTANNWGEPFDQKMNIAIASNQMPDILPLYNTLFMKAMKAKQTRDLGDIYEKYASQRLKDIMNLNDGAGLKALTFEEKLMGICSSAAGHRAPLVWIRNDWMSKLGLTAPQSIDDLIKIAQDFANKDPDGNGKKDTVGFGLQKEVIGGFSDMDLFFNAYHTFGYLWIEKDGGLQLSSTLPEIKEPLKKLAELYQQGVLDQEFPMKSNATDLKKDILSDKVGMLFNSGDLPVTVVGEAHRKNGVDWTAYVVKDNAGIPAVCGINTQPVNIISVSPGCKNPEAVIKLLNFAAETLYGNPEWVKGEINEFSTTKEGYLSNFYAACTITDPLQGLKDYDLIQEAVKTKDTSKLSVRTMNTYNKIINYQNNPNPDDYGIYKIWGPQGSFAFHKEAWDKKVSYISKASFMDTPSWVQNGQNLYSRMKQFFGEAIYKGNVDEQYDSWIKYFNDQGGQKATQEITDLFKEYYQKP